MAKKKGRRKKRSPSLPVALFAFSGMGALFLASFIYLYGVTPISAPPLFEELLSPASSSLNRQITKIDQAIYGYLHEAGVPQENIAFLSVRPKHENRIEWDFADLLIRIPRKLLLSSFETGLKRALSLKDLPVRIRVEGEPQGVRVVHVYAGPQYTHRIRLQSEVRVAAQTDKRPGIALIIDDLGYDFDLAKSFLDLPLALNLALLPKAPFTKKIAQAAQGKGWELLLHLPMEPENHPQVNPGPEALLTKMGEKEIRAVFEKHLNQVPGARGVNNHMGSRFTRSEAKMRILMTELKGKGLFYVDSRTTNRTVALDVARRLGVPAIERSVFLDNDLSHEAMAFQLQRLLAMGRHSGKAVGIAHPHPETVAFLRKSARLLEREAEVVHVSKLVE
jgi:uncharacterized protein